MQVGDLFVFVGNNIDDSHFKNFTYGKQYKIKSIECLPDGDTYGTYHCILFENHKYGCLSIYLDKYFITLDEFRNKRIINIIK
jgi:hypothetical protein